MISAVDSRVSRSLLHLRPLDPTTRRHLRRSHRHRPPVRSIVPSTVQESGIGARGKLERGTCHLD